MAASTPGEQQPGQHQRRQGAERVDQAVDPADAEPGDAGEQPVDPTAKAISRPSALAALSSSTRASSDRQLGDCQGKGAEHRLGRAIRLLFGRFCEVAQPSPMTILRRNISGPGDVMAAKPLDLVGIGNAIVDVIAHADDRFLTSEGLAKGAMTLIDQARGEALYARMGAGTESLGRLGGQHDRGLRLVRRQGRLHRQGARRPARPGLPPRYRIARRRLPDSGRGRRAVDRALPHHGHARRPAHHGDLSRHLDRARPEDLDRQAIADAAIVYLEGYLWDPPQAKAAFLAAAKLAHDSGGRSRSACRRVLHRAPPRRFPRPGRRAMSTSCSPTRPSCWR